MLKELHPRQLNETQTVKMWGTLNSKLVYFCHTNQLPHVSSSSEIISQPAVLLWQSAGDLHMLQVTSDAPHVKFQDDYLPLV